MASTNKTTNYELSQYLGADKPTYLGDYNSDMLKIDAGMHQNALDIATADEKATLAGNNANTALTNASNAQTTADTANTTANSALSKATENETKISNLENIPIYSENEIEIGKWTDNKPLYRKVIEFTITTANNWSGSGITFSNIDKMCKYDAFLVSSNTVASIPRYESSTNNVIVAYSIPDNVFAYYATTSYLNAKIRIIAEYTKQ